MLLQGWQRGRCGDRRRGGDDDRRAVQQRPRLRCLLHPLGRRAPARPERLRARAGGLDARLLPAQVRRRRAKPPMRGWDSVTVPGAVSAWTRLSERFGKLPFADLLEPAIEIAERGYAVAGGGAAEVGRGNAPAARSARLCRSLPAARSSTGGRRALRFAAAARALRAIAATRGEAFYGGEIAAARSSASRSERRRDHAPPTSPPTGPSGSSRSASTTAATGCTRSRRTGRASPP